MEVSSSALTGSTRLVLQVISAQKAPSLEIYQELRNRSGPPQEFRVPNPRGTEQTTTVSYQDIFIQFILINVGGARAENVQLHLQGDFSYFGGLKRLSEIAVLTGSIIPQLAPGQAFHLFRIDEHDLYARGPDGKPSAMKKESFTIRMQYDGPNQGLNKLQRWWCKCRKRSQYETVFAFDPHNLNGVDLPAMEYA